VGISQVLWGSIGYSVGAACGAVLAAEEFDPKNRVVLFVGDGSLQLTVQELSSMIRYKNKPYIFILNNAGYTIEKLIHGETAEYNNIQPWKHQQLLDTFGGDGFENIRIHTIQDLNNIFSSPEFAKNDKIRVIELMLDVMDLPENLIQQAQLLAKTNSG
jgi:pyruvate decarboxylase